MTFQPNYDVDPPKSKFGVISLLVPVIAGLLFFGIIHLYPSDPAGFGGVFLAIFAFFGMCALGLILSIIGIVRKERIKWLSWLGFLINLIPTLIAMSFVVR